MDQFLLFLILRTNTIFTLNEKNSNFYNFFIIDIYLKINDVFMGKGLTQLIP